MKNKDVEASIGRAFAHATPDLLDSVLSACEKQERKVICMTENKKRNPWIKRAAAIAAALVVLVAGAAGYLVYNANFAVSSTVCLDVNPSIEIKVNQKERVLAVNARNEDAKVVLGDMDFKGSDLDVAVNALIGSMLQNGYLSELANSILISVDNDDPSKGQALQQKLTEEVNALLQQGNFSGAVLSQTVSSDAELQKLAEEYGITPGKAQLIRQIVNQNPLYQFEDLVPLSINELNLLSDAAGGLELVDSVGTASDKAYIGAEKAQELALGHAGIAADDAAGLHTEMDYDDGVMVYEVEFGAAGFAYDYDVDALTGAILKSDRERDDDYVGQSGSAGNTGNTGSTGSTGSTGGTGSSGGTASTGNAGNTGGATAYIGEDRAKQAALSHAGVSADSIAQFKCELDRDNGVTLYEIEFKAGGYEYDYHVNASDGTILKSEKDRDDDARENQTANTGGTGSSGGTASTGNAGNTGGASAYIGEDRAKQTALSHAGVSADSITQFKCELDRDNGVTLYEIEFKAGGYEYEYDINAATGTILKSEKDRDD